MHVSAKDKATNKEQRVTITSISGLNKDEVEKLIREAKEHEAEDKNIRDTVEKRNRLDGLIFEIEKAVNTNKEKIAATDLETIEKALEKAKNSLKEHENNPQELQKETDELTQVWHKIAAQLYQASNQEEQPKDDSSKNNNDGSNTGPIDTEFS